MQPPVPVILANALFNAEDPTGGAAGTDTDTEALACPAARRSAPPIRLLIVTDGYRYLGQPYGLDYSRGPMGLSQFVASLLGCPGPARFDIALAHLDQRDGAAMMDFDRRIRQRIAGFAFDDPGQFRADSFDVLFLFGCLEKLSRDDPTGRRRISANGTPYPVDRLADTEIAAIGAFLQDGGGLFAAGDSGRAGRLLGHGLPLVGKMRRWTGRRQPRDADRMAGMGPAVPPPAGWPADLADAPRFVPGTQPGGARHDDRHDERQDDRPAAGRAGRGPVGVSPGAGAFGPEFPDALDGGPRPLPQPVRAGPPGATGLCAYDGHRAGIGRAITASTWRPFLNASLLDLCGPAESPASIEAQYRPFARRGLGARSAALALWLARPGTADRSQPRA